MLMSPLLPEANSQAVTPLMAMPMVATMITVRLATGSGIEQPLYGFQHDGAAGDQQQHGVDQRGEDRGIAQGRR